MSSRINSAIKELYGAQNLDALNEWIKMNH